MRAAFFEALSRAAASDPRVCLVVGDLGYSLIETFQERFPKQFVNAGVAEQNMTGLAAGMALSGKVVFTYSIANFSTLRCLEQIRNDVCYHHANVRVVAVGGGVAYGALGVSHHATEDLAILRSLPEMTVIAPGDPVEARLATDALVLHQGPAYLRLGKSGEAVVHNSPPAFDIGRALTVRDGADATLIATGSMLKTAVDAADKLREAGTAVRVLSMHTVAPLDEHAVRRAAAETPVVFTLEEHSVRGGLGGAVAEVMAGLSGKHARLQRLGLAPRFNAAVGDQRALIAANGLDLESVITTLRLGIERRLEVAG